MQIADPLLTDVRYRINTAIRDMIHLENEIATWLERTGLQVKTARVGATQTFEHTLHTSRAFPSHRWSTTAGRAINEARSALDNLNALAFESFADHEYDPDHIYFPITTSGKEWRSWRQRHRALPEWMASRYRELQPSSGPYRGLAGLRQLDNDRKHKRLTPTSLAVTGLLSATKMTLEGVLEEGDLRVDIEAVTNELAAGTRSVLLARTRFHHKIIDVEFDETDDDKEFAFQFHFGNEAYSLAEVVELTRRVSYAVEYAAKGDRLSLGRYLSRPQYATDEGQPFAEEVDDVHA